MLIEFELSGVAGDAVGVGAHATVEVDGVAFEGSVGLHAEVIRDVSDEFAGAVDDGELSCFEASEEMIDGVDAGVDDEFWSYDGFCYQFIGMVWCEWMDRCLCCHGCSCSPRKKKI